MNSCKFSVSCVCFFSGCRKKITFTCSVCSSSRRLFSIHIIHLGKKVQERKCREIAHLTSTFLCRVWMTSHVQLSVCHHHHHHHQEALSLEFPGGSGSKVSCNSVSSLLSFSRKVCIPLSLIPFLSPYLQSKHTTFLHPPPLSLSFSPSLTPIYP